MSVRILAVGDVVGRSGVEYLCRRLKPLQKLKGVDFTVVNAENASNMGLTPRQADEILAAGADALTLGNHAFSRREILPYLDDSPYILRPLNFMPQTPGRGCAVFDTAFGRVAVLNLIGRCGMDFGPDNPFFAADKALKGLDCPVVIVDMHAEATSEKQALGFYLDGRVSAIFGTHTHVQTSDAGVLPKGTGFITDAGMTGPAISVLGIRPEQSVSRFLGNPHERYEAADGPCKLECALFEVDPASGRCLAAEALRIED